MVMRMRKVVRMLLVLLMNVMMMVVNVANSQDYGEALTKSLLFFEGQRSGKLPPSQRITWRKDSALLDGSDLHGLALVQSVIGLNRAVGFVGPTTGLVLKI
ncbi:hypothetical protein HYC85_013563 [Camellia sinensis]|uniref:cellulase n=1 Tax=Camellia sinensis TaxID=4442 RepID=A0A7J7H746_CAMSI|nr:hypothetical protein HYC85_013563 [Camellia sinensis]